MFGSITQRGVLPYTSEMLPFATEKWWWMTGLRGLNFEGWRRKVTLVGLWQKGYRNHGNVTSRQTRNMVTCRNPLNHWLTTQSCVDISLSPPALMVWLPSWNRRFAGSKCWFLSCVQRTLLWRSGKVPAWQPAIFYCYSPRRWLCFLNWGPKIAMSWTYPYKVGPHS